MWFWYFLYNEEGNKSKKDNNIGIATNHVQIVNI